MSDTGCTVDHLLKTEELTPLDARALLAHTLGVTQSWLLAHGDAVVAPAFAQRFLQLAQRRRQGEPVAYLVGHKEFWGMTLAVTSDVLIPRPDTETLVEVALRFLPDRKKARVLDLGTGSGAVALAIAKERSEAEVHAIDASEKALEVAERNARHLFGADQKRIKFVHCNWFSGIEPYAPFDVIVGNPPYIAVGAPHWREGDVRFEPKEALLAGEDGLDDLRVIIAKAPRYLKNGGVLLLEHGFDQARAVAELLSESGLTAIKSYPDLAGILRVTGGSRP